MANLRDLIVRGTAKFLGKIFAKEIEAETLTVKGKPVLQEVNIDISKDTTTEEPKADISIVGSSANLSLIIPETTSPDGAYMYVRYAPNNNPSGAQMTTSPDNSTTYIGTYLGPKLNEFQLTQAEVFTWSPYVPGQTDINVAGRSEYLHIAYANKKNGSIVDFSKTESETVVDGGALLLRYYIGTYVDNNSTGSEDPDDYTWTRFRGIDGKDGVTGTPITGTPYYFHIAYCNMESGSNTNVIDFSNDISEGRDYTGTYVDDNILDSDDPNDYVWRIIQGEGGISGKHVSTNTMYYMHVKYSSDGGFNFTGNSGEDPGPYIGVYVDTTETDSTDIDKYNWSKEPNGILSITEWYGLSNSPSQRPGNDGWSTNPNDKVPTESNRYLWNFEDIYYSNGIKVSTTQRVIGVYGETGESIGRIENYYLATNQSSGVTTGSTGWNDSVTEEQIDETKPYLWAYEKIYGDNNTLISTTTPTIISTFGAVWYTGEVITGKPGEYDENGNVITWTGKFSSSGITFAKVGDQYLNTKTGEVYKCTTEGNSTNAAWSYRGNVTENLSLQQEIRAQGLDKIIKDLGEQISKWENKLSDDYYTKEYWDGDGTEENKGKLQETRESIITQTSNNINLAFTKMWWGKEEKPEDAEEIYVEDLNGKVTEKFGSIDRYFDFSGEGLSISDSQSTDPTNPSMVLNVSNDGIQFTRGGKVLSEWVGDDFMVGNIYVKVSERARFGNFAFIPRSDGSLMLLKVGDN